MRFHEAIGILSTRCEKCGHETWAIESSELTPTLGASVLSPTRAPTGAQFEVLALTCQRCGNLWMMSAQFVRDWLAEHPV